MGDVVSLIEKAQEVGAAEMDAETAERMKKADFTFDDFLSQIVQVRKMGGIGEHPEVAARHEQAQGR